MKHAHWVVFASALLVAGAAVACSDPRALSTDLSATTPTADTCAKGPYPGCACAAPGAERECGAVKQVVGKEVMCSIGHTRCNAGGVWGACEPERVVVRSMPSLHLLAASGCADPCTPECAAVTMEDSGVPGGFTASDAGIFPTPQATPATSCTSLAITPSTAPATDVVVTSSTTPAVALFASSLVPAGCNPTAPSPLWYTDTFDVAQMDPSAPGKLSVVVPIAQTVTVGAVLGSFSASVQSRITVAIKENGTANPPPAGASFAQFPPEVAGDPADPGLAILYPYNDTMLPMGLLAPLVQWTSGGSAATGGVVVTLRYPATGTPIFEASQLVSESMAAPVPLRAAQPRHVVPQPLWFAFEQTIHRNRATLGDAGRILVRRRVAGTTYKAQSVDVHVAPGQLKGRVYYNSYGTALVSNYSGARQSTGGAFPGGAFGAATLVIPPGASAPTVAAGYSGGSGCYVCHSASADGATLVTASAGYVATKYTFPGTPPSGGTSLGSAAMIFGAINPTSTRMFSSAGAFSGDSTSRLYDGAGALLAGSNAPAGLKAGFPSFAHDGSAVVFNYRGGNASPLSALAADGTSVAMMSFDGDRTFSSFRKLVTPAAGPSVWPTFLPAGQNGVVYEVETRTTPDGGYGFTRHDCECSTYSGATGELWWVSTGATPVANRLHRANGYDATGTASAVPAMPTTGHAVYGGTAGPAGAGFYEQRYNYEPTVLPKVIGGYSWVVFTSRRAYGNVATINPYASDPRYDDISIDPTPKKLWIAAISSSPTAGTDPSWPAFYLPGQELVAGNSRAVFALEACHPAVASSPGPANLCDSDLDCCGAPGAAACVLDPPPIASPPVKHCITTSAGACRAVGQTCTTTGQCCNAVSGGVCAGGVCTDPPPYYQDQVLTREFTTSCPTGALTRWGLYDWRSRTPTGTSIEFFAQVSSDGGATWYPPSPVKIGTAQGADVVAPLWATSGLGVSAALGQPQGTPSGNRLRVAASFHVSTDHSKAPTLVDVRQASDCPPSE